MTDPGEITIFQRICWGQNALNAYSEDKEGGPWGVLYDDPKTVLCDLLADLMHYAQASELDFAAVLQSARMHFDAEKEQQP